MQSERYFLGENEHVFSAANLKLTSKCFVTICSAYRYVFPISTSFETLFNLASSKVWVARGNGLQLSIDVLTDELALDKSDRAVFLDGLGSLLCRAEVLTQDFLPD